MWLTLATEVIRKTDSDMYGDHIQFSRSIKFFYYVQPFILFLHDFSVL